MRTESGTVDLCKCHSGYVTNFVDANQDTLLAAASASANIATIELPISEGSKVAYVGQVPTLRVA